MSNAQLIHLSIAKQYRYKNTNIELSHGYPFIMTKDFYKEKDRVYKREWDDLNEFMALDKKEQMRYAV